MQSSINCDTWFGSIVGCFADAIHPLFAGWNEINPVIGSLRSGVGLSIDIIEWIGDDEPDDKCKYPEDGVEILDMVLFAVGLDDIVSLHGSGDIDNVTDNLFNIESSLLLIGDNLKGVFGIEEL